MKRYFAVGEYTHILHESASYSRRDGVCEVDSLDKVKRAASHKYLPIMMHCVHHYRQRYRSGHNGADSKNYPFYRSLIFKTLDFLGIFGGCSALCETVISQFSRIFQNLILYSLITVAAVFIYGEISKRS